MGIRSSLVVLSLFTLSTANAGIFTKDATHFKKVGEVDSFQWAPDSYQDASHPNPFFYDIFYYIPKSLNESNLEKLEGLFAKQGTIHIKNGEHQGEEDLAIDAPEPFQKAKAIIFDHGGGASTVDRAGSNKVVGIYMPDLKALADSLGIIVVLPSANGLNWGGHTPFIQRALGSLMRKELNIDPNHLGLAGHSMGGMGITRSYLWLADEFAFFMPLAAGMDLGYTQDQNMLNEQINKVFNVPYIHLQGLQDEFQVFVDRCRTQLSMTQALETAYGTKSKLDIYFYDAPHDYDLGVFRDYLSHALDLKRDLYQPELHGSLWTVNSWPTENNILFHANSIPRYFWVEAINSDTSASERINFHAKVEKNVVSIDFVDGLKVPVRTKQLRVYLSSKLENLFLPVHVQINGKEVGVWKPSLKQFPHAHSVDPTDAGFIYDASIDVSIPQS